MSQKVIRDDTRSDTWVVANFALLWQEPVLQLEEIYHDETTDDEEAKEKALCAE
jgi:hypothetical protein